MRICKEDLAKFEERKGRLCNRVRTKRFTGHKGRVSVRAKGFIGLNRTVMVRLRAKRFTGHKGRVRAKGFSGRSALLPFGPAIHDIF